MHKLIFITIATTLLITGCGKNGADKIFTNGNIYLFADKRAVAEAVAISNGKVIYAGTRKGADRYRGEATEVIDLMGATMLPGLIDAHIHVSSLGKALQTLDLVGTESAEDIAELVRREASLRRPGEWIEGRGWDQNDWQLEEFPTKRLLDDAAPHNPVALRRIDGHAIWVNSEALRLAGFSPASVDPPGGRIIRLPDSREPSGVLIDNAVDTLALVIPEPSHEILRRRVLQALSHCAKMGLTTLHDAGVDLEDIAVYKELAQEGRLKPRVYAMLTDNKDVLEPYFKSGPEIGLYDDQLTIRTIKAYADGALGSRGAYLLEPYSDDPGNRGLLVTDRNRLYEVLDSGVEFGFQVSVHAIGDGANHEILAMIESLVRDYDLTDHRFRIEHAQVLAPEDIPRFRLAGVIPAMQPTHCTSDMYWAEDRLGPERIKGAYAWRSLLNTGIIIPGGSDAPVESANPLWGIYAAITRTDHNGYPEGGWQPQEKVTIEEAVAMYTQWAAYAAFEENLKGTIEPGFLADFTVLTKDIFVIEPEEILTTEIAMTVVGGEIIYTGEFYDPPPLLAESK